MKLQSAHDLTEKIRDGRKLTLLLQWKHLTTSELKEAKAQMEQILHSVVQGQQMIFVGVANGWHKIKFNGRIPKKKKLDFKMDVNGFVCTEKNMHTQRQRAKRVSCNVFQNLLFGNSPQNHLYSPATLQESVSTAKAAFGMERKEYLMQHLPVEVTFHLEQKYCADGTYNMQSSISVSGYAIGYEVQKLADEYSEYLQSACNKTNLFAGYIFYETIATCAHAHYHGKPQRVNGKPVEPWGLSGYEWSAFICRALAEQLPVEQLEELRKVAEVSTESTGILYRTRCDISQYGLEQKRRCQKILYAILQPGYGFYPVNCACEEYLQPADQKVYLLKPKRERTSVIETPYFLGFFYKMKPEEVKTSYYYDIIEEIEIA